MKNHFIKPDFNNNIINVSATVAQYLGCPNDKPILPKLLNELNKGYKNIVFLILDGMGIYPVNKNLSDDSFIKRNIKQVLTSVFPSTTTNAMTTYLSNKYPMEHGWFGWSLYFEELNRAVSIFLDRDSYTDEPIERGYARRALPYEPFYKRASSDYTTSVVVPEFWDSSEENRYVWNTLEEMLGHIENISRKAGKQCIFTYCTEPDSTMHRYGVSSPEAHEVINALNSGIEELYNKLTDTLFIVTADHGQIDVDGHIEIYKDKELLSMLEWPLSLEPRATAFKVKENCRKDFARMFNEKYGSDFELFEVEQLIKENYFGGNIRSEHAKRLGDFIAICKTHKIFKFGESFHDYRGHHTSLTEEMEVPLIFIGKK